MPQPASIGVKQATASKFVEYTDSVALKLSGIRFSDRASKQINLYWATQIYYI